MAAKADSIAACPDIEELWNIKQSSENISVSTTDFLLSHSDVGPFVHIICPKGTHVVGPNMITCLEGGVWDDVTFPSCSNSSLYGVAKSDIILISVLAGCGAIVVISLTIILAHLLCYRYKDDNRHTSAERLNRSSESIPSASMYLGDKHFHTISTPTEVTLNGRPFTRQNIHPGRQQRHETLSNGDHSVMSYSIPSEHEYSLPRYYLQSSRIPDEHDLPPPPPPHDVINNMYNDPYAHAYTISSHSDNDMVFVNAAYSEDFPPRDYRSNWDNEYNAIQARSHTLPRFDTRTTF